LRNQKVPGEERDDVISMIGQGEGEKKEKINTLEIGERAPQNGKME